MEPLTLKLSIETTPGMDHTQVADAGLVLRRELEDAPFAEFVEVPAAEAGPRPGSKGGEALTLGALLLAVLPEAVPAAIGFIKEWALRPGNRPVRVRLQAADKALEVEYDPRTMTADDVDALVASLQARLNSPIQD